MTTCGFGSAGPTIDVTAGAVTLTYDTLQSGKNNDCPDPMAPAGVVSVTIERPSGMPPLFTLCVGRPDKLNSGLPLGAGGVKVIDVTGTGGGCTYVQDDTMPATGTAKSSGLCKNAIDPAGFALTINGTVNLKRTCGATVDTVAATIDGTVAVLPQ